VLFLKALCAVDPGLLRRSICYLFTLALLSGGESFADEIDDLFQHDEAGPGCAYGYAKDGEIQFLRGFGLANLEHEVPITASTRFHVASVSKQFTGAVIGLLALEGKINLLDDVRKYVPAFPEYDHTITLEHLLQHSSGIKNHTKLMGSKGIDYGNSISQNEALDLVFAEDLNFVPGTRFEYSSGYLVLARVVEEVTDTPFREVLEKRLFEPLGMKNTGLHDDFSLIPNRAEGYLRDGDQWINDRIRYVLVGSGGLHMTIEDLLIWSHALRNDKLAKGLNRLIFESATMPVVPETTYYNFGLFRSEYRGQRLSWHTGSYQASRTTVVNFEPGMTTVIACNNRIDVEALSWKLVAKIAPRDRSTEP
jgi:CubicO group peptidase (beta-lactamase class C family)